MHWDEYYGSEEQEWWESTHQVTDNGEVVAKGSQPYCEGFADQRKAESMNPNRIRVEPIVQEMVH